MAKRKLGMNRCNHCGGNLIEDNDLFIYNDKNYNVDVLKCEKCHISVMDFKSLKKLRQEIKPTLFERIKNIFNISRNHKTDLGFFKGKVL